MSGINLTTAAHKSNSGHVSLVDLALRGNQPTEEEKRQMDKDGDTEVMVSQVEGDYYCTYAVRIKSGKMRRVSKVRLSTKQNENSLGSIDASNTKKTAKAQKDLFPHYDGLSTSDSRKLADLNSKARQNTRDAMAFLQETVGITPAKKGQKDDNSII